MMIYKIDIIIRREFTMWRQCIEKQRLELMRNHSLAKVKVQVPPGPPIPQRIQIKNITKFGFVTEMKLQNKEIIVLKTQ